MSTWKMVFVKKKRPGRERVEAVVLIISHLQFLLSASPENGHSNSLHVKNNARQPAVTDAHTGMNAYSTRAIECVE
jgi:hypothetical protein